MHRYVYWNIIYNDQDLKATSMLINKRMDREDAYMQWNITQS